LPRDTYDANCNTNGATLRLTELAGDATSDIRAFIVGATYGLSDVTDTAVDLYD
jgi:hypothetical protein